jgi:hypothetical protein
MNALSPVSADLIGRLRALIDTAAPRGRALLLLERAERATAENAREITNDILAYLKALKDWDKHRA